jgi:hypothetical protein
MEPRVVCSICSVVHLKIKRGSLANWVSSFASLANLVVFPEKRTCKNNFFGDRLVGEEVSLHTHMLSSEN